MVKVLQRRRQQQHVIWQRHEIMPPRGSNKAANDHAQDMCTRRWHGAACSENGAVRHQMCRIACKRLTRTAVHADWAGQATAGAGVSAAVSVAHARGSSNATQNAGAAKGQWYVIR
jgi:hypothetical protein